MSTYKILPQIEDEVLEVEIIDSQIEELTKLQEYDYFWKTLSILCWDNKDFMNRRCSLIDKIDKKIKHENRLCLYILLLPFIIVIGILRFIKKLITCFLVRPNGRKKKFLWLMFVLLITITVFIIITLIVIFSRISLSTLIYNYIVRVAFTDYQGITDAVAQLKKNDLQEVFRELSIAGVLTELALKHPEYVSKEYISNMKRETVGLNSANTKPTQKPNMVTSQYWGTHYTSDTKNWDEMIFFLYPQNQTYIDLEKYPPASNYFKISNLFISNNLFF